METTVADRPGPTSALAPPAEGGPQARARSAAFADDPLTAPPDGLSAAAGPAWQAFVHGLVSHHGETGDRLAAFEAAAGEDPLAPAVRGLVLMTLGRAELAAPAATALAEARRRGAGRRCDRLANVAAAALADWLAGDPGRAADRLDRRLARVPGDLFLAKMVHAIRFMAGDRRGMRRSVERTLGRGPANASARGYLLGCHAFALEETGEVAAAERAGRRALELAPDDAWALHALAHVHEVRVAPEAGLRLIAGHRAAFAHCSTFRFHVHWHEALFELELGRTERVLALYDGAVRAERTDDFRDIANAVSLLARLALEGVDVGPRWEELAEKAEARIDDGALPFADLHYVTALAASGRHEAAERLVARLAWAAAETGGSERGRIAGEVAAPTAAGIAAFFRGRAAGAFRRLAAGERALAAVGGSNAQRDLFARLAIEAALAAGFGREAANRIRRRARRHGGLDRFGRSRLARAHMHGATL